MCRMKRGSSFVIGYDMIEEAICKAFLMRLSEVGIVCFDAGGCAVRVLAREASAMQP